MSTFLVNALLQVLLGRIPFAVETALNQRWTTSEGACLPRRKVSPNLPSCHGQVLLVTNDSRSRYLATKGQNQNTTKILSCSPSPGPGLKGYKAFCLS